jgi:hypothetical protein
MSKLPARSSFGEKMCMNDDVHEVTAIALPGVEYLGQSHVGNDGDVVADDPHMRRAACK